MVNNWSLKILIRLNQNNNDLSREPKYKLVKKKKEKKIKVIRKAKELILNLIYTCAQAQMHRSCEKSREESYQRLS